MPSAKTSFTRPNFARPNFVFIMADQMAGPALPINGHGVVKTPYIESLAQGGVTFRNAYCNNPICASSRFSMMAGQLPSRIGAYDNAAEFPAAVPTFAHYLRHLGYRTCLSGKMHFVGPDQLHGFERRVTTDIYPSDFGWTPDWTTEGYPFAPSVMSLRGVVESGLCVRSLQIDYDEEVEYFAKRKLYDFARERTDRPFFLAVSFTHPHNPFTITEEYWNRYRDDDIDMPSVPHIPVEERDPWSQRYYYLIRQDEHEVTDAAIRRTRRAYYGMIFYVDDKVGELLRTLDALGMADNTVVVFTADHGDMMASGACGSNSIPTSGRPGCRSWCARPAMRRAGWSMGMSPWSTCCRRSWISPPTGVRPSSPMRSTGTASRRCSMGATRAGRTRP